MKKVYLIDWNSFIYRMFFGVPEFSTKDWKIVNAIFGMAKFFVTQLIKENPDYIIFIKDAKWTNFRHDIYSDYKATRDRMPDSLRDQIWDIEKMIKMMGFPIIEISGYEADDVIWTLAVLLWENKNYEIDILTWDKDLYSLVSDNVKIYDTMKRKKFWVNETEEKFWVKPCMIIDYLSIVWDKADNIPWIEGFWPKKAVDLINIVWWIEKIYILANKIETWEILYNDLDKSIQSCFKWKTFDKLINSKDNAFLSKKLATIPFDVDIWKFDINDYKFKSEMILNDNIKEYFRDLEFNSLIWEDEKELKKWDNLKLKVKIIWNKEKLDDLCLLINNYENIVFDTETTWLDIMTAELVWISIYLDDKNIFYINRLHEWDKINDYDLKEFINKLLDSDKTLVAHNLKYDLEILEMFLANNYEASNSNIFEDQRSFF